LSSAQIRHESTTHFLLEARNRKPLLFLDKNLSRVITYGEQSRFFDLMFDFPDDATSNPYTTVTVYYKSFDKKGFSMERQEFMSKLKKSTEALEDANRSLASWMSNKNIQPYDVKDNFPSG